MELTQEIMVDPVCGEEVAPSDAHDLFSYQGECYYFCSLNCQIDFEQAPEKYVGPYA